MKKIEIKCSCGILHVIPTAKKDYFKYCCCCGKKLDYESKRSKKGRKASSGHDKTI